MQSIHKLLFEALNNNSNKNNKNRIQFVSWLVSICLLISCKLHRITSDNDRLLPACNIHIIIHTKYIVIHTDDDSSKLVRYNNSVLFETDHNF